MRSHAYRRHKRAVKLTRRYRLLAAFLWTCDSLTPHPKQMHWHINCNCWDDPRHQAIRRRREELAWRREWDA